MGFLDFFRSGPEPSQSQLGKAIRQITQPHGDPGIRMGAADRLREWGTPESVAGLLRRFTVQTPSGQVDLEERQHIEAMLVELGEVAVKPIVNFLSRESAVSYPARALKRILQAEDYVGRILDILEGLEADFGSSSEQRSGLLRALEGLDDERIAPAVRRLLGDPSDDVAIAAMERILEADDPSYLEDMVELLVASGDRLRVRQEVAERLAVVGWPTQHFRKQVEANLPDGFAIDKRGRVVSI